MDHAKLREIAEKALYTGGASLIASKDVLDLLDENARATTVLGEMVQAQHRIEAQNLQLSVENTRLLALNQQLVAEAERLREALRPFSERVRPDDGVRLGDDTALAKDCRRARAALERKS